MNKGIREGKWTCAEPACGKNNFTERTECFKCNAPRSGSRSSVLDSTENQPVSCDGDWICSQSSCGGVNFSKRMKCLKSQSSCDFVNFAMRMVCFKCKAPRSDNQPGGGGLRNQGKNGK